MNDADFDVIEVIDEDERSPVFQSSRDVQLQHVQVLGEAESTSIGLRGDGGASLTRDQFGESVSNADYVIINQEIPKSAVETIVDHLQETSSIAVIGDPLRGSMGAFSPSDSNVMWIAQFGPVLIVTGSFGAREFVNFLGDAVGEGVMAAAVVMRAGEGFVAPRERYLLMGVAGFEPPDLMNDVWVVAADLSAMRIDRLRRWQMANCARLLAIRVSGSVKEIGELWCSCASRLRYCDSLRSIRVLGHCAFEGTQLPNVELECVEVIGFECFAFSALAEVSVRGPGDVRIESKAFAGCLALRAASLPLRGSLGPLSFAGCSALGRVRFGMELRMGDDDGDGRDCFSATGELMVEYDGSEGSYGRFYGGRSFGWRRRLRSSGPRDGAWNGGRMRGFRRWSARC